jgi:hypothetical protein
MHISYGLDGQAGISHLIKNLSSATFNGSFLAHKEGAIALLQLRNIGEFYKSPFAARLYEMSYMQMVSTSTGVLSEDSADSLAVDWEYSMCKATHASYHGVLQAVDVRHGQ